MTGWRMTVPLAVALTSPDLASAGEQRTNMAVSYADLDLSQQADANRLRARVQGAIRTLCAQPRQGVLTNPAESLCRRAAMAAVQEQIERTIAVSTNRRKLEQSRIATAASR